MNKKIKQFERERERRIASIGRNKELKRTALRFVTQADPLHYLYNFSWLGRPIIQYPQDIVATQELIWKVQPDLIIETGIAHGGSLILSASILELIGGKGKVLGIDIDIRAYNKEAIRHHPLSKRISMIEGSSTDPVVVEKVRKFARGKKKILVFLDSSHTEAHVLKELELYSPLVSKNSYLVAFDTVIESMPKGTIKNRPWDKGSNPGSAVKKFLRKHKNFRSDTGIESKLLITCAPGGFLRRIR